MSHEAEQVMDKGGAGAMIGGATLWVVDKLSLISVNDVLTGVSLFIGIIWVCFKIRNEMLTYKINKKTLNEK